MTLRQLLRPLTDWLTKHSRERQAEILALLDEYGPLESAVILNLIGRSGRHLWSIYGELEHLERKGVIERFWDREPTVIEEWPVRQILMPRCKYRRASPSGEVVK